MSVLCRIDAYATYVAEISAATAQEAVELASASPEDYNWDYCSTEEFDDRLYIALDDNGWEIEETELRDF